MSANDVQRALTVADQVASSSSQNQDTTLRIKRKEVMPLDEFQREIALLPRAFPHLFPFGLCGFNNKNRPYQIDDLDFRGFVCHLMKLTYRKENGDLHNPFQEDAMFVHYCNNRIHRIATSKEWTVYLQYKLKDRRLLSDDFTYGDFKKLSLKKRAQIINHAVTHMRPQNGDPGDLKRAQDEIAPSPIGECGAVLLVCTNKGRTNHL